MSEFPILNPGNYLSYLTPQLAAQYEVFRDVQLVALGAYICDMLSTIPQEVKMMQSSRLSLSISVYWIARTFPVITMILVVYTRTGPVNHCQEVFIGQDISYTITGAATAFLFLMRVRAVFFSNKAVHWCFSVLWLATIVAWILAPIGGRFTEIADTKHCIPARAPRFLVVGYILPLVYDSLVFLAISYKIITSCSPSQCPLTWKTLFSRPFSHRLPRSILHGGQQYYLVSVCTNVITVLLLLIPTVPTSYRAIVVNPGMALTTSMTCRVFRNLYLEDIEARAASESNAGVVLTSVVCPTGITSVENATSPPGHDQDSPHAVG